MLFYASPILYVATMVPEELPARVPGQPDRGAADARCATRSSTRPRGHVWDAIGGAERLLVPLGIVVGVFVLGLWVFRREAPRIAENL